MIYFPFATYLQTELYPDKVKDFKGSMIKVSRFNEEVRAIFKPNGVVGADAFMARMLAKRLNATLIVKKPADNDDYVNPTNNRSRATGKWFGRRSIFH